MPRREKRPKRPNSTPPAQPAHTGSPYCPESSANWQPCCPGRPKRFADGMSARAGGLGFQTWVLGRPLAAAQPEVDCRRNTDSVNGNRIIPAPSRTGGGDLTKCQHPLRARCTSTLINLLLKNFIPLVENRFIPKLHVPFRVFNISNRYKKS